MDKNALSMRDDDVDSNADDSSFQLLAHRQRKVKANGEHIETASHLSKPTKTMSAPAGKRVAGAATAWHIVALKLWNLSWPLSGMEVLTFTKELIVTGFVGHLGPLELSSLVLAQTLYNVAGNAPMLGIVAAMETFCAQAYGAKKYATVGIVLQRALMIVTIFNVATSSVWSKADRLLLWMGQDPDIAIAAGRFTFLLSPCLIMDGIDQCMRRYLSSQSVVLPLMFVNLIATLLAPVLLWYFIIRCDWGFDGAAVAWNCVQAISMSGLFFYLLYHNSQQEPSQRTWTGWTREALTDWIIYIKVSIPSMVMLCLDWWTFEIIVMLSGLLPRPEVTMSMMGITFNIHELCFMAAHGLSGAASTRVGNELGAARPRLAWLSCQVAVLMGTLVMVVFAVVLIIFRHELGWLFSSDKEVIIATAQAVTPLAVSLVGEGANTVLAGVLRGCGRQHIGASVNLVMYWVFGLPISCFMAFRMGLGALGLWTGLASTASVQALLLTIVVFKFDWQAEAVHARALLAAGELDIELESDDELEDLELPTVATKPAKLQS